jgi:hypothetical protein
MRCGNSFCDQPPHDPGDGNPAVRNARWRGRVLTKERIMRRDSHPRRVWSAALAHTITEPVFAVVMGVSGSGKTTVSALLAAALGCQFQEGDDLHPAENVEKMHGGTPLTLASQDRRGNRRLARAGRIRRAGLLSAETFLPRHQHRRPPGRDAGLPQRIVRPHPPAHGGAPRALYAGGPAR